MYTPITLRCRKKAVRSTSKPKRNRPKEFKRFDPSEYQRQREKRLSIARRRRNLRASSKLSDRSFESQRSRFGRSRIDSGYTSGESQGSRQSRASVGSTGSRASRRRKSSSSKSKRRGSGLRTSRLKEDSPALKENLYTRDQKSKSTPVLAEDASSLAFAETTNRPLTNNSTAALELSDIDGRLNALQNFLKAAKTSSR